MSSTDYLTDHFQQEEVTRIARSLLLQILWKLLRNFVDTLGGKHIGRNAESAWNSSLVSSWTTATLYSPLQIKGNDFWRKKAKVYKDVITFLHCLCTRDEYQFYWCLSIVRFDSLRCYLHQILLAKLSSNGGSSWRNQLQCIRHQSSPLRWQRSGWRSRIPCSRRRLDWFAQPYLFIRDSGLSWFSPKLFRSDRISSVYIVSK